MEDYEYPSENKKIYDWIRIHYFFLSKLSKLAKLNWTSSAFD